MSNILCIGAHPDDVELSMGGSIFRLKEAGHSVVLLDVTDGEPTPHGSIEIRAEESTKAAELLEVKRITLDIKNRFIEETIENRIKLAEVFREVKPDYIFTHYEYDVHPDHIAVNRLTDSARFYSKLTKCSIKGEPFFPKKVIYYFPNHIKLNLEPSFCVDVSPFIEKKKQILECYESQFIKKGQGLMIREAIESNRYFGMRIQTEYAEPFYMRDSIGILEVGSLFLKNKI
ncbi:MAG TPA: PIG-L family deacetylase [Leptospiraceae bacterium]|nr:PIG-L family deacetylase [Leptospiraceae bacterium]HMW07027.1 PIG-L family deacetylase [Leptospiraceae bacterium]HMX35054.1 PIG-L family deacetylase [Leptospiraceae bacterium]HMY33832.1 PIG-L family deacetylase [Leptospiraceae bacterium]HMZ66469.1 PIG-L family deacetylase [Leptospiraceae bacterium]